MMTLFNNYILYNNIIKNETKLMDSITISAFSKVPDTIFIILVGTFSILSPLLYSLLFLFILIIMDFIGGVWSAKHNKIPIIWVTGIKTTLRKMLAYTLVCFSGFILDKFFIEPVFKIMMFFYIFMLILAIGEFKSILGNFGSILGMDLVAKFLKSFGKDKNELLKDICEDKK